MQEAFKLVRLSEFYVLRKGSVPWNSVGWYMPVLRTLHCKVLIELYQLLFFNAYTIMISVKGM